MSNVTTLKDLQTSTSRQELVDASVQTDLPVLRLRPMSEAEDDTVIRSALEELLEQHAEYQRIHGNNEDESISAENPITAEDIFNIVKKIYHKITNGEIAINENSNETVSSLIQNEIKNLNEPILNQTQDILNTSNLTISNVGLRPFGSFGDMTLNELAVKLSKAPLDVIDINSISALPLHLIGVGLLYRIIAKTYVKHLDDPASILTIQNIADRRATWKLRYFNLTLGLCLLVPAVSGFLSMYAKSPVFDGVKVNYNIKNPDTEISNIASSLLPFFSFLKKKKSENNSNKFRLMKELFVFILLVLFTLFVYWLIQVNKNILMFFMILTICVSFVYCSLAYFILIIKNEIIIDFSRIKIKFIRDLILELIDIKNSGTDLNPIRRIYIIYFYLTLFALFTLPLVYFY